MYEFKKIFKRNHRIVCLLLSGFLFFGTVTTEYLEVQAFDWVAPSLYLPFVDAMPYLMGLLGVSPSNDDSINWDAWRDEYEEYAISGGLSNEALHEWMEDVSSGTLNQASEAWIKFKAWVKSKALANTIPFPLTMPINSQELKNYINSTLGTNFMFSYNDTLNGFFYYIDSDGVYNLVCLSPTSYDKYPVININGNSQYYVYYGTTTSTSSVSFLRMKDGVDGWSTSSGSFNLTLKDIALDKVWFSPNTVNLTDEPFSILNDSSSSANLTISLDPALIDNLSLALSDAISTAIPGVIPLPWDQIGDTVDEITDTIDALIEQVNTGVISISAYMQAILDLVGAIAVDTTTDLVYPQNPDKPDETIDDKVNENKDNMGFTLFGLEKVFPFCIPFDIYAFLTLLVAEPVAPVINWPVYNPITQQNEIITIDFSTWNSVVVLFRYIFDFLFIIGMLLMARALIGGGDSA